MPSQRLLLDATDLFAALGGSMSPEGPTGTVASAALEELLREFSLALDSSFLTTDSTTLSFEDIVELLRNIHNAASQGSYPTASGRHSDSAHHRRGTGLRRSIATGHRVGFPAVPHRRKSAVQEDFTTATEADSKPPTPSEAADADSLPGTSPSSLLLTPRSDDSADHAAPATGSNARADLPGGAQKPVSSVFSQKLEHGATRNRLDRRTAGSKGPFVLVEDSVEDPLGFKVDAIRATLGPMAALAAQVSALPMQVSSATERSPILLRAEALEGIGATRFTTSVKPDAAAMTELFPVRRKYTPYSLQEVEDILHSIDSAHRPMHKRAQRAPHSSVAFSGRVPIPRLGVMALEELARATKPSSSPLKSNLPRIALLERRNRFPPTTTTKRMPKIERERSRLPQLSDPYRHRVAATPLSALAQQPSFLAPLAERVQQRELFASLRNPTSVDFQQAASPPPGQRFHCHQLPTIAANVLGILDARRAIL